MGHPWPEVMMLEADNHTIYTEVSQLLMLLMHDLKLQMHVEWYAKPVIRAIQTMLIKCHAYWTCIAMVVPGA
jgi:hypothetical protein